MTTPYVSEIRLMAFNFAPKGWAFCNGQLLPIAQNQALFALLGTTYGGDGIRTFALPNLQGRVPIHAGPGYNLGQSGGENTHTLATAEMASHNHALTGQNSVSQTVQGSALPGPTHYLANAQVALANTSPQAYATADYYGTGPANRTFAATAIGQTGNSQGHPNEQPYLVLTFCIALVGIFPTRS